jgi:hypothetical protein
MVLKLAGNQLFPQIKANEKLRLWNFKYIY